MVYSKQSMPGSALPAGKRFIERRGGNAATSGDVDFVDTLRIRRHQFSPRRKLNRERPAGNAAVKRFFVAPVAANKLECLSLKCFLQVLLLFMGDVQCSKYLYLGWLLP